MFLISKIILSSSYESPACIRFPSNVIALSAIELSESSETCRFLRPCPEDLSVLSQLKCDPLDLKHSCLVILINSYSFSRKKILDYLLDECGFRGISPSFTSHLILKGAADD